MRRPITFFSSFCIILFLTAIAWVSFGIYVDRKNGSASADAKFAKLLEDTTSIIKETKSGTPEFSARFLQSIENIDDYSSLKLVLNGQTIYSYPPAGFVIPSPDLIKSFKSDRLLSNGTSFTLSASIYLMKTDSIYRHSRFSFILILSGTLIALLTLFILKLKKTSGTKAEKPIEKAQILPIEPEESKTEISDSEVSPKKTDSAFDHIFDDEENQEEKPQPQDEETSSDDTLVEKTLPESQDLTGEEKESIAEKEDSSEPSMKVASYDEISEPAASDILDEEQTFDVGTLSFDDDNDVFSESDTFDDDATYDEDEIDQMEKQNMELSEFESSDPIFDDTPALDSSIESTMTDGFGTSFDQPSFDDLASPVTGLKTYSQFEQELSEKLQEAQDAISIAFIRIKDLNRGNSISKAAVSIISRDLKENAQIYEYQSDGYAVLCTDYDLNRAVTAFDNLYDKIIGYLKLNNAVNEVVIGISSTEGRTIPADRIITEAEQALHHAEKDTDSPIIAFKANPEKYKEYAELAAENAATATSDSN